MRVFDSVARGSYCRSLVLSGLCCSAVSLVAAWMAVESWAGWVPEIIHQTHNATAVVAGLGGAVFFAWAASPEYAPRNRETGVFTARTAWEKTVVHVAMAGAFALITCTLPLAVVSIVNVLVWPNPGTPHNYSLYATWWLGTCFFVIAMGLVGVFCARNLPPVIAALVAAAATYLLVWIPVSSIDSFSWSGISAFDDLAWVHYWPPLPEALTRAGFWLFVALGLVSCLATWTRMLAAGALAASLSLSAAIMQGPDPLNPIPGTDTLVCEGSQPEICTALPFASGLDQYRSITSTVFQALPDSMTSDSVRVYAEDASAAAPDDVFVLEATGIRRRETVIPDPTWSTTDTLAEIFLAGCTENADYASQLGALYAALHHSGVDLDALRSSELFDASVVAPMTSDENRAIESSLNSLGSLSKDDWLTWLDSHAEDVRGCKLSPESIGHG